jgi:hypothetical protein
MLHQAAMLIIFFIAAVPKTANASNSGVVNHFLFLCLLTPFSQRQRLRQLCSFAILLFFLIGAVLNRLCKIEQWALKTVAAAASP